MEYHPISFEGTPRQAQFDYFRTMANPYVGLTAEVDAAALLRACHAHGWPFSLALIYCIGRAARPSRCPSRCWPTTPWPTACTLAASMRPLPRSSPGLRIRFGETVKKL